MTAIAPVSAVTPGFIAELNANFAALTPPWPASAAPDLKTYLQGCVNAGVSCYWFWGNGDLPAPVTITLTQTLNSFVFDGGGATFTAAFNDNTSNCLSFIVPDTVSVQIDAPRIQNFSLNGTGSRRFLNGLFLSCKLAQSSIFAGSIDNVTIYGAHGSGCLLYGNVFEMDIKSMTARDNDNYGLELRNPTAGGGTGPISSINCFGGDFRTNVAGGIGMTADTTFQEPAQALHVYASNFISNGGPGIVAPAGVYVHGSHFENNSGTSGNCGIRVDFSWSIIESCNGGNSNGGQTYLVNYGGGGPHILRSSVNLTGKTAYIGGACNLVVDGVAYSSPYSATDPFLSGPALSSSVISTPMLLSGPTPVTGATATVSNASNNNIVANFAGTVTLTLPDAAIFPGMFVYVRTILAQAVVSASSNIVPLIGGAAGTAIVAATAGKEAMLRANSDGTSNWQIMQGN